MSWWNVSSKTPGLGWAGRPRPLGARRFSVLPSSGLMLSFRKKKAFRSREQNLHFPAW